MIVAGGNAKGKRHWAKGKNFIEILIQQFSNSQFYIPLTMAFLAQSRPQY